MTVEYAPSERADMREQRERGTLTEGRHRAIRQHAFVQHRSDDKYGCGFIEHDEGGVTRCGYYRQHHPTMLTATDA